MTLLSIAGDVSRNVGIQAPPSVMATSDPDAAKLLQFINDTGQELTRRLDWAELRKTVTITGSGTPDDQSLPADFARMTRGLAVKASTGDTVRGGLSDDEWTSLVFVEGTPRFYRLSGRSIGFWPYLGTSGTASVSYQSKNWTDTGTAVFEQNEDGALLPEDLIVKGAVWRFLRHLGKDFSDWMAEYEAALADYASFDKGSRVP